MSDYPPIPEDHPIQEIWKLNRIDVDGYIQLARDGDNDAAKVLLARYAHLLRQEQDDLSRGVKIINRGYQEYKDKLEHYILDAIIDTLRVGDANYGFNLIHAKNHRPKLTFRQKQQQCRLAYQVAKIIDSTQSENKGFEIAEIELGIKKSTCRAAYAKYMKPPKQKFTKK